MEDTSLLDRIELRRHVGRELLVWLWFESELFEATLTTKQHGSFGLWPAGRLVLTDGRESTTIKGVTPGAHREAKEALRRGKTPERMGLTVSIGDGERSFFLRGDTLAIGALTPPAETPAREGEHEDDALADRMHHAGDVEGLVEALYRDFLALRLSPTWDAHVVPAIDAWIAGDEVDADAYAAAVRPSGAVASARAPSPTRRPPRAPRRGRG